MKRQLWAVVLFVLGMAGATANAAQGDWLVRARAIYLAPDASSSALNLNVDTRWAPELDFSYFATNNLALELILATRQHDVSAGNSAIGSVKHLPPTLTLQYHFLPDGAFRPYVGAGINYTRFYDVHLQGGAATVDRNSWGGALQVGFDVPINKTFFVNFDVKKVWIDTDVKSNGAKVDHLNIDPLIVGFGVGMKF